MGGSCSCNDDDKPSTLQHTTPNIKVERKAINIDPKQEHLQTKTNINVFSSDAEDEYESPTSSQSPKSKQSKEKVIQAFKQAISNSNDSLAIHFVDEYPELDLCNSTFENGDNCLQVAVRNSSYNLIYYLLTNGISVKLYTQIKYTVIGILVILFTARRSKSK